MSPILPFPSSPLFHLDQATISHPHPNNNPTFSQSTTPNVSIHLTTNVYTKATLHKNNPNGDPLLNPNTITTAAIILFNVIRIIIHTSKTITTALVRKAFALSRPLFSLFQPPIFPNNDNASIHLTSL